MVAVPSTIREFKIARNPAEPSEKMRQTPKSRHGGVFDRYGILHWR
jgi:hypothetical protein